MHAGYSSLAGGARFSKQFLRGFNGLHFYFLILSGERRCKAGSRSRDAGWDLLLQWLIDLIAGLSRLGACRLARKETERRDLEDG